MLAGWAKADSAPLRMREFYQTSTFGIQGVFNYTDGTTSDIFTASFNPDTNSQNSWQYTAQVMVAEKAYSSITVRVVYDYNVNLALFDGIQLYKEAFGSSYTYDEDGNVKSVKDLQGQTTSYEYNPNGTLAEITEGNKAPMTYTYYENSRNVKTATSPEGIVYNFTYDDWGNNLTVSIGSGSTAITSSATYTTDRNRLASTKDAVGNETIYSYNADTNVLEWVQYPEDTETTRTNYTYDDMYRMASASATAGTETLSASYTYDDDDLLSQIKTGKTTYNFGYGDFGLRTTISIGNRLLATYKYTEEAEGEEDQNYDLDSLDYNNGDSVQYEYDNLGRVIKETFEDGQTVEYKYDNYGALATVYDSETDITTTYYYDFTDRLMKYVESSTGYNHSVGYEYDQLNNLTALVETINGVKHTTSYTYDDDNRIKTVTASGTTVSYTYDSFGRVTEQVTTRGSTTVLTEQFFYRSTSEGETSQIATYKTIAGGVTKTYTYTYDDNGNILTVSEGGKTTSYVYDSQNQLIRENNEAGGFTHEWTYDNAGNILTRKEYDYTTGTLGTPTDTVSYTYGDSDWGDLLTAYDGQAITYDNIGNPLTDGTWTYTWKHGRQLASMSKSNVTWTYTYNSDGLRTKRTTGNSTYIYGYTGDKLTYMKRDGTSVYFSYDANGSPTMMLLGSTPYFYVTNVQGDVVALTDSTGAIVAEYAYDAWGNVVTDTSSTVAGIYNPLRYRGYVYDSETGLYYLQSRYYDPELGRFLNADGFATTGQGLLGNNMFAYCLNNPVMYCDPSGEIAIFDDIFIIAMVVVVIIVVAVMMPLIQQVTYNGVNQIVSQISSEYKKAEQMLSKAKGKDHIRDSGLAQESDEEVQRKARDNSLPKSERRRYQKEEKGRGLRNKQKRNNIYN